jgi:predicted MFS family arabinose efflux permease
MANGVSFLFVIGGLLFARTRFKLPRDNNEHKSLGAEFKEGLTFIRRNSVVNSIILMAALVGFFGMPLLQQIPALARDVLGRLTDTEPVVAERTSLLYAAQGVGALTAALMATLFSSSSKKGRWVLIGQIAFIIPLIGLGYITQLHTSTILLLLIGWGTVTQLVAMNTLIQLKVPNELRGRVFSIYLWALQGVAPFGSLLIGWMAQNWGIPLSALIGGLVSLFTIGVLHFRNPGVRKAQA